MTENDENNEIRVTLVESGDTSNLFVWNENKLIAKIWLHSDGSINYRSLAPEIAPLVRLRDNQIQIEKDIKFNTPPKKKVPMRIKFKLKDLNKEK